MKKRSISNEADLLFCTCMHTPVHGVIFDLYHTLIHIPDTRRPLVRLMERVGLERKDQRKAAKLLMTQPLEQLEQMAKALSATTPEQTLEDLELLLNEELKRAACYAETLATLEKLQELKVPLFLLSNAATPYKHPFFELELDQYFNQAFFSCDIGYTKPDTKAYQLVSERVGIDKKNLLMVGDSIKSDYRGGGNAGLQALHLDRQEAYENAPYRINTLLDVLKFL